MIIGRGHQRHVWDYRSKLSYNPLRRHTSCLKRQDSSLARGLNWNCKYQMSSECLALNNETTRHSSHKKPDEACNLSLNPKGVMSMLCSCRAQTKSYNLVTFYTHLSGDVSLVWKLAHKLIKQRCNCPQQLTKFEHWTNFLQDLCGPISLQTARPWKSTCMAGLQVVQNCPHSRLLPGISTY